MGKVALAPSRSPALPGSSRPPALPASTAPGVCGSIMQPGSVPMSEQATKDHGHPDHPMGDPAAAARVLAGLRDFDPVTALDDLGTYVDAVKKGIPGGDEQVRGEILSLIQEDRKSTRLNSSHLGISYAVFCLKK